VKNIGLLIYYSSFSHLFAIYLLRKRWRVRWFAVGEVNTGAVSAAAGFLMFDAVAAAVCVILVGA
jgi:hypothetical protein